MQESSLKIENQHGSEESKDSSSFDMINSKKNVWSIYQQKTENV